ncbi:hypothetical protein ACP70R_018234 [Stipagrostis hirtigluma subsp. patula]
MEFSRTRWVFVGMPMRSGVTLLPEVGAHARWPRHRGLGWMSC